MIVVLLPSTSEPERNYIASDVSRFGTDDHPSKRNNAPLRRPIHDGQASCQSRLRLRDRLEQPGKRKFESPDVIGLNAAFFWRLVVSA